MEGEKKLEIFTVQASIEDSSVNSDSALSQSHITGEIVQTNLPTLVLMEPTATLVLTITSLCISWSTNGSLYLPKFTYYKPAGIPTMYLR